MRADEFVYFSFFRLVHKKNYRGFLSYDLDHQ